MTELRFNDETLMAFVDGELDAKTHEAVERAIPDDAELTARVEMFRQTSADARDALAPLLNEPVPDALMASVAEMVDRAGESRDTTESETVVAFRPKNAQPRRSQAPRWALPLAASVALIVGGAVGYLSGRPGDDVETGIRMASFDQPGLVQALNSVAAGEETALGEDAGRFRAIASFKDRDDIFCREFEVDNADRSTVVAVACRPDSAWVVQFAVVAGQSDSGYAPASSLASLDAYLEAVGAGAPLSAEDEAAALRGLASGP